MSHPNLIAVFAMAMAMAIAVLSSPGWASAQAILTVTTTADDLDTPSGPDLSLREAIRDANGADTIGFDPALDGQTTTLTHPDGQLVLDKDLTIDASNLPTGIDISGNDATRICSVSAGVTVTLRNLTLRDGRTADGVDAPSGSNLAGGAAAYGGAILNTGDLTLENCRVVNNATGRGGNGAGSGIAGSGGRGGGIYSMGHLRLTECTIQGNGTGAGGTGGDTGIGGTGGFGGGVACPSVGTLVAVDSVFKQNSTGDGGNSGSGARAGSGGSGGGIHAIGVSVSLTRCQVLENSAGKSGDGGLLGRATNGGSGGGIYTTDSNSTLVDCVIEQNTTGDGGTGGGFVGTITYNSGGDGGGIAISEGDMTLTNCTVAYNGTGNGGAAGDGLHGGYGGVGGGIIHTSFNEAATLLTLINCTVADNQTGSGTDGGRGGPGGGIFNLQSNTADGTTLRLVHSTVVRNTTGPGSEMNPSGLGAGISLNGSTATVVIENSIVADNVRDPGGNAIANDISGDFTTTGQNIVEAVSNGTHSGPAPISADPLLAPLGDYGGLTQSMPPAPGSPAIDAGVLLVDTPATDQRGAPRPTGPAPDLGAVEAFPFSMLPLVDTDTDWMDDRLEPLYGFVVGIVDGQGDSDGDGSKDFAELGNTTHPLDARDYLRILSCAPGAGFDPLTNPLVDLTWTSFPGLTYDLECAQDLDFDSAINHLGDVPADSAAATTTATILLQPGVDFARVLRK